MSCRKRLRVRELDCSLAVDDTSEICVPLAAAPPSGGAPLAVIDAGIHRPGRGRALGLANRGGRARGLAVSLPITQISYSPACASEKASGLLGFVRIVLADSIALDGLTIRRERTGSLSLSFPRRRDARGNTHDLMRPVHDHARRVFQRQVFDELHRRGIYP